MVAKNETRPDRKVGTESWSRVQNLDPKPDSTVSVQSQVENKCEDEDNSDVETKRAIGGPSLLLLFIITFSFDTSGIGYA